MSSNVHVFRKTVDPSAAPTDVGQHWINQTSGSHWISVGTSAVGDWKLAPGINQLTGDVTAGPGVGSQVATLAATIPNPHTWSGDQTFGANVNFTSHQNSSLTGSNVRIPSHPTSSVHFTNSSLVSIGSANNGGVSDGHCLFITNETGSTITIVNNYGGAAAGEKILTGSGANITIANGGSFALMYNTTASLWNTFGGGVGVLAVTGTAPIASSGGSTPAISIATADTSTTGALTSTDWNTFNGKANSTLNNLGTTAVNAAIIPDGDNTRNLGTAVARWADVFLRRIQDASDVTAIQIANRQLQANDGGAKVVLNWSSTVTIAKDATNDQSMDWTVRVLKKGITGTSADYRLNWDTMQLMTSGTVKLDWSGTDLDINTRKIVNVVDPSSAQDAATKNYVDTQNTPVTSAISASAIDWATLLKTGGLYTKTLAANTTFTFSNRTAGQTIVVRLTNTASNYTVTWPTVKWSGGAAPTMTVGVKSDIYTFIYDGTNVFGSFVQNMS